MNLELRRNVEGIGFVICVCGERSRKQIIIPLSTELSVRIADMLAAEGIKNSLMLPSLERS